MNDVMDLPQAPETDRPGGASPWADTQAAAALFMVFPLIAILARLFAVLGSILDWPAPVVGVLDRLLVYMFLTLVLAISFFALLKGFPRWTFPYWGMALASLAGLLANAISPPGSGRQASWVLFAGLFGLALVTGLFWDPLRPLYKTLQTDWTLLPFSVYGVLPLALLSVLESAPSWELLVLGGCLILAAGALAYMRLEATLDRGVALMIAFTLAWAVTIVYRLDELGAGQPGVQAQTARFLVTETSVWLFFMLVPGIWAGLRRLAQAWRK